MDAFKLHCISSDADSEQLAKNWPRLSHVPVVRGPVAFDTIYSIILFAQLEMCMAYKLEAVLSI